MHCTKLELVRMKGSGVLLGWMALLCCLLFAMGVPYEDDLGLYRLKGM